MLIAGLGRAAFAHGDLHERIVGLSEQLNANPSNAVLLLQRADLQRQHGELNAALEDAGAVVQLRPDWAAARLQQARVLLGMEKWPEAQSAADAALRLEPDNADALVIRSRCFAWSKQTDEAIADLTRVLSRKERALPDLYLERARLQSGAGDAAGALKGLDEGIQKLGDTPSLVLPALEYERQLGAYDAALKRLDSVQKYLPPESAMALRGEILAEAGRSGEAREVFGDASTSLSNRTDHARRPAEETAALEARLRAGLKQINTQSPPSGLKK